MQNGKISPIQEERISAICLSDFLHFCFLTKKTPKQNKKQNKIGGRITRNKKQRLHHDASV